MPHLAKPLVVIGLVFGMPVCVVALPRGARAAEGDQAKPYVFVPDTVSQDAKEYLKTLPGPGARPLPPSDNDPAAWKKAFDIRENERLPLAEAVVKRYQPEIASRKIGGVPVLEIRPRGWKDNGQVLVYAHGGAYTFLSAKSTLPSCVAAADATGLRVISIDYTVAPAGRWEQVTDEVLAVLAGLQKEGIDLKHIAIYGDSAGGGLAAGAVLKMRDRGLGMPAAVVLWSPWADITDSGDTYFTLRDAEPTYDYRIHLKPSADAYADEKDQKHPYVSPVYGDYTKGFPPTLVQGGTKEIFLSNFVRQYRAIADAGGVATLDLYEGMPHVFQTRLAEAPEGKAALKKMREFLTEHLAK